jgi:hypothetical protein
MVKWWKFEVKKIINSQADGRRIFSLMLHSHLLRIFTYTGHAHFRHMTRNVYLSSEHHSQARVSISMEL